MPDQKRARNSCNDMLKISTLSGYMGIWKETVLYLGNTSEKTM